MFILISILETDDITLASVVANGVMLGNKAADQVKEFDGISLCFLLLFYFIFVLPFLRHYL